ncbi:MAG: M23 family metallopeptidase [bacterium]|nr:M23 family metallopeptidase [bacterium]MCY4164068.1 M23 family metallopeptidase [bacterium]
MSRRQRQRRTAGVGFHITNLALVVVCGVLCVVLVLNLEQTELGPTAQAQMALASEVPVVRYQPAIQAEVVDFFRPPAHIGAPGNRGWEYSTANGQAVYAAAAGEVLFAGTVATNRFVTLLHADGLRTTYGYLTQILVEEGDVVADRQVLGTTSDRFFFSVRAGEEYLDPAHVLAVGRVRLVA